MPTEFARLRRERHAQIRTTKRWLRYLPRRATLHRYPVLKWFAEAARRRDYLWSFQVERVVPALYAGCIITCTPLYGAHLFIALALAVLLRANLPILAALQFVSNPLTVPFMYWLAYLTGDFILGPFGMRAALAENLPGRTTPLMIEGIYKFLAIFAGGILMGYVAGFVLSFFYQYGARRAQWVLERLRHLERHPASATSGADPGPPPLPPG